MTGTRRACVGRGTGANTTITARPVVAVCLRHRPRVQIEGLEADFLEHPDKDVVEPEGPFPLPPGAQWAAAAPILRTVIGRRLRDSEWQALEAQARAGVLSATTLVRETSAQGARGTLDAYLNRLRGQLAETAG